MKIKFNKSISQCAERIKDCYHSSRPFESDCFKVITQPFKVIKLTNILKNEVFLSNLKEAVSSLPLSEKNNDLYSLKQSQSLHSVDIDVVREFIQFLKRAVRPCLEGIFGYAFNDIISVTASLYQQGDVLLCHDDKCEDRCVAFVYYLSDLDKDSGGSFDMFKHNDLGQPTEITNHIPPKANSFICFEVGNYTYHQVSEVKSGERLSINGWFHCEKALSIVPLDYRDPLPPLQHQVLLEGLVMLDEFITTVHCTPSYIDQVREAFSEDSYLLLSNFFTKSFYSLCEVALKSASLKWTSLGPANRRKYEVVDVNSVKGPVKTLISLMKSSLFISYLKSISSLSLEPFSANQVSSKLILECQRWTPGCYTMATDNDSFFDHDGLDIYLFFGTKELEGSQTNCGSVTYLDSAGDPSDPDNELITIEPVHNSFCAVYRTFDTVRFTKYINSHFKGSYYCLAATYYEVDHQF